MQWIPERRILAGVLLAACVLLAGCTASQSWSLGASGNVESIDDAYRFTGEVSLGGKIGEVTAEGVRIVFLDANESTLKTVKIGTLGEESRVANLSVVLDQPPKYVLVKVERVDAPENSEYGITGLEHRDDGRYYPYSE